LSEDEAYSISEAPPEEIQPSRITLLIRYLKKQTSTKRDLKDFIFKIILSLAIIVICSPFFLLLYQVGSIGVIQIFGSEEGQGIEFFTTFPGPGLRGGILNAIVGTLYLSGVAGLVGIPLSVLGAVYINEYSNPGRVRDAIEFGADVLAGIPSIVFGAFGLSLFVTIIGLGTGVLAGGCTLAFMMIPTILRTTQEALRAVPQALREASLALGATKWTTTWKVTIRAAFPGIITGVLLAYGRIIGETAPLIFTSGNSLFAPSELLGPSSWVASIPYTIYLYIIDPRDYLNQKAYAAALVLMMIVLAIDLIANVISRKVTRRLV
jgi:phosphate transport system permease protein